MTLFSNFNNSGFRLFAHTRVLCVSAKCQNSLLLKVRQHFQKSKLLILLLKNHLKLSQKYSKISKLSIKNFEKLKFENFLNLSQHWIQNSDFRGVWITPWGVSPGHPGELLLLIFDILKRKIQNLHVLPLKTCAQ